MTKLRKYLALVFVIFSVAAARPAKAQYRSLWYLNVDTVVVHSPGWYIKAQNFIPYIGGIKNAFLADSAGILVGSGEYNIGIGVGAARGNTVLHGFSYKIGIGYHSLYNTYGSGPSIAIGNWASGLGQAQGSIAIGDSSNFYGTKSEIAIGPGALKFDEGGNNIALGPEVFQGTSSAPPSFDSYNIGIGSYIAEQIGSDMQSNVLIGKGIADTGGYALAAQRNVCIGINSMYELGQNASDNAALGNGSGRNNPGSDGTFCGARSGEYSNGDSCVFIGNSAGSSTLGNDRLVIANSTADSLISGNFLYHVLSLDASVTAQSTLTVDSTLETGGNVTTASDYSTTSATQANVPGLSVYLEPNTVYQFSGELFTSIASSAGETESIYYGGNTPGYVIYGFVAEDNSVIDVSNWTNTIGTSFSDNSGGGAANVMVKFHGAIHTGSVGADLTVRYAQTTTQTTANVVKEGSFLNVYRSH